MNREKAISTEAELLRRIEDRANCSGGIINETSLTDDLRQEMFLEFYTRKGTETNESTWKKFGPFLLKHAFDRVFRKHRLDKEFPVEDPTGENSTPDEQDVRQSVQASRVSKAVFERLSEAEIAELREFQQDKLTDTAARMRTILTTKEYHDLITRTTKTLLEKDKIDNDQMEKITTATQITKEAIMKTDLNNESVRRSANRARKKLRSTMKLKQIAAIGLVLLAAAAQAAAHICQN